VDLDRQPVSEPRSTAGRPQPPQRVPETRPTPLGDWFIYLSVVVLICGVIAISALEFGARLSDLVVRVPLFIGGALLFIVTADALVRVWRSAWAWLPVDRGRGLFRFVWTVVLAGVLVAAAAAVVLALLA
jgi:hypothetical protein